jgi:hypothetical protein
MYHDKVPVPGFFKTTCSTRYQNHTTFVTKTRYCTWYPYRPPWDRTQVLVQGPIPGSGPKARNPGVDLNPGLGTPKFGIGPLGDGYS